MGWINKPDLETAKMYANKNNRTEFEENMLVRSHFLLTGKLHKKNTMSEFIRRMKDYDPTLFEQAVEEAVEHFKNN